MSMTPQSRNSCCLVCGASPTVKSHILPRALALDLKRGDKHLMAGRLGEPGLRRFQNGRWSWKILCDEHERQLGLADKYGVEIVRAINSERATQDFAIPNRQPSLLKKFVLSLIWRADAADRVESRRSRLGSYDAIIKDCIFGTADLDAPLYFLRPNLTGNGKLLPIAVEPTRIRVRDCNGWKLGFGNLDAIIKLDKKPWPRGWRVLDAGVQTSVTVLNASPSEISEAPAYHPLIRQVKAFKI